MFAFCIVFDCCLFLPCLAHVCLFVSIVWVCCSLILFAVRFEFGVVGLRILLLL